MHTTTNTAVLEARSQAQALDWSLVLISQGIESVPTRREDDGAWVLEISEMDLPCAQSSIAAYEHENRRPWRREVKWTGLLFDARALLWFVALILFHWFVAGALRDFKTPGEMNCGLVRHGEWWRLFTAVTLHGDVSHLMANATTGLVFLGLAMGCYGAGHALLLSFLGGALGNVATFALHDGAFRNVGASGMVMASLGLLAAHSVSQARQEKPAVWIGRGVIAGCLLVVFLGFSPKSDVVAHVGGFVAGALLGIVALKFHGSLAKSSLNAVSAFACVALVVLMWALALR